MKKKCGVLFLALLCVFSMVGCSSSRVIQASSVEYDGEVWNAEEDASGSLKNSRAWIQKLEQTEIYNDHGVAIASTRLRRHGLLGRKLIFTVENSTEDDVVVQLSEVTVNGYAMQMSNSICEEVAGGETTKVWMYLYRGDLRRSDIRSISSIEFMLSAYGLTNLVTVDDDIVTGGDETWSDDVAEPITIYTSADEKFEQPVDDSGILLYDTHGIRVVCQGLQYRRWDGDQLMLYIENNSDQNLTILGENIRINGNTADQAASLGVGVDLLPGTRACYALFLDDLEGSDIHDVEDIEEISIRLYLMEYDTYREISYLRPAVMYFDPER